MIATLSLSDVASSILVQSAHASPLFHELDIDFQVVLLLF
jgi:hypothetical protein